MAAQPHQQHRQPTADPQSARWEIVRKWPSASGETKLAWWYLLGESDNGRRQVVVDDVALGADQGHKEGAGRKRRAGLAAAGLIVLVDDRRRLYEVCDPLDLYRQQGAPFAIECGDPQGLLFDMASDNETTLSEPAAAGGDPSVSLPLRVAGAPPGETPTGAHGRAHDGAHDRAHDRQPAVPSEPSEAARANKPLPSVLLEDQRQPKVTEANEGKGAARSCARPGARSDTADGPQKLGGLFDIVERGLPTPGQMARLIEDEQQRIEELAAWLKAEINCSKMRMSPCLRMARGYLAGRLPAREINNLLGYLGAGAASEKGIPRSQYANAAFNRMRRQYGIE